VGFEGWGWQSSDLRPPCDPEEDPMTVLPVLDSAGRRCSPATMPGCHAPGPPRNKGMRYPADPPTVEEIIAVMRRRTAGTREPIPHRRGGRWCCAVRCARRSDRHQRKSDPQRRDSKRFAGRRHDISGVPAGLPAGFVGLARCDPARGQSSRPAAIPDRRGKTHHIPTLVFARHLSQNAPACRPTGPPRRRGLCPRARSRDPSRFAAMRLARPYPAPRTVGFAVGSYPWRRRRGRPRVAREAGRSRARGTPAGDCGSTQGAESVRASGGRSHSLDHT
jgi:hypothetical protein